MAFTMYRNESVLGLSYGMRAALVLCGVGSPALAWLWARVCQCVARALTHNMLELRVQYAI